MAYPSNKLDQFVLRLPDGMRDEIAAAAKANGRSMNSEIILRLGGTPPAVRTSRLQDNGPSPSDRDELAKAALSGLIGDYSLSPEEVARRCYSVADAMLAERAKP